MNHLISNAGHLFIFMIYIYIFMYVCMYSCRAIVIIVGCLGLCVVSMALAIVVA